MKDEVKRKESSPSVGVADLVLVRWTQSEAAPSSAASHGTRR